MAAQQLQLRYKVVAMDGQCALDPVWQHSSLQGLSRRDTGCSSGVQPLPLHVFELQKGGVDGFRLLQQAGQIGKAVMALGDVSRVQTLGCPSSARRLCVSGGTGGLGLLFGHWLVQSGVGRLVLLSRKGATAPGGQRYWQQLASLTLETSASVGVELSDVATERESNLAVEHGRTSLVHSAGVLADALLSNQTQVGLQKVWGPKAAAARAMHRAGCETNNELELFVLFSSVAALLGNPGQANYAAANACLDALSHGRQEQGLAGTSVKWGAWAGVGMAVASGVEEQLRGQGMDVVTEEQGLQALELALKFGGG